MIRMPLTHRALLLVTGVIAASAGPARAQPVTGLYIAAGAGGNFMQNENFSLSERIGGFTVTSRAFPFSPSSATTTTRYPSSSYGLRGSFPLDAGGVGLLSVGYGLGNGLRLEVEGNYRINESSVFGEAEQKFGGMVNALYDLPVRLLGVTPYGGLGAGYMWVDRGRGLDHTDSFAYQAILGGSLPIPVVPGLAATLEYRFLGLAGASRSFSEPGYFYSSIFGSVVQDSSTGKRKYSDGFNHSITVGLRYAFNAAPLAPAAAAEPVPAAPTAARTYLVFFDWDRADLTPRARQIIAEAAQATTRVQVTRIEVNGYTDTSGTVQYNQALSVRRAESVANELVRDGVPRAAISLQGFGQTHLLVPTANGVREPQNRRVEIVLR